MPDESLNISMQEIARARRAGRQARRPRPQALPILVVFALLGIVTFLYSPAFDVREVAVRGNAYFSAQEVVELARVPMSRNMLLIRSEGIIERILKAPRMESAEIRKKYPSRMEITVVERTTVAYLPYGGFFIDLDENARAIGVSEAITDPNVPIITGMEPTFVLLGGFVEPSAQAQLASMLGSELTKGKVPGISEVNVKDMQDIVIITNDGSRIMLGASDGISVRLAMALDILSGARARKQAFKYIDVRVAERPVLGTK